MDTVSTTAAYIKDLAQFPLLSAEEEVELAQRIEAGRKAAERLASEDDLSERDRLQHLVGAGKQARSQMIESNLRLVVSIARRYVGRGLDLADLVQEGSIGLGTAVDKYEWQRGFRFSTYAFSWIHQAISRSIQTQCRVIRLPQHTIAAVAKVNRAWGDLHQELGREPKVVDLAAYLELKPQRVRELVQYASPTLSLETPLGKDEPTTTLGAMIADRDTPTPVDAAEYAVLRGRIEDAMETLSPRQRQVLRLRYGLEDGQQYQLDVIGKRLGVTGERVRQLEQKALKKLRGQAALRTKVADYIAA